MALKIKESANEIIKKLNLKDKRIAVLLAVGLICIVLIMLSETVPKSTVKSADQQDNNIVYSEYLSSLETHTEELISSIDGVGRCKVMITLKESSENIYAKNSQENKNESSYSVNYEYVLYDGQEGEEPVLIKQYFPSVQGVAVVCDGADNTVVRESIINSISSLYNISVSKISVSKYKG